MLRSRIGVACALLLSWASAPQVLTAEEPVLVFRDDAVGRIEAWGDDEVRDLRAQVASGRSLVVVGRAVGALPESRRFSDLLGREHGAGGRSPERRSGGLRVSVRAQDQPLTQCLTHLLLPDALVSAWGNASVKSLAEAPYADGAGSEHAVQPPERTARADLGRPEERWSPVIWTREEGRGRVFVLAIEEPLRGERDPSLIGALAERAVELASRKPLSKPLPTDLPLAAEVPGIASAADGSLLGFPQDAGYFRGRRIAPVMSHRGADWLVRPDREESEAPERVLDALRIPEGSTVADLGAGVGYFSFRLARRVGTRGRVLAVDIQEEMLTMLKERAGKEGVTNVEAVLATETDPRLPEGAVDLVLLVDVYHELARPDQVLAAVRKALRRAGPETALPADGSGDRDGELSPGRLALVEYRGEDPTVPILPLHRMTHDQARAELKGMGFRWLETHEFLPHQRVIVFAPEG